MRPVIRTTSNASGGAVNSTVAVLDYYGRPEVSLQAIVTGTANYTIQQTLDNVLNSSVTPTWINHPDTNLVASSSNVQGNYAYIPAAVRMVQNNGSGSVTLTIIQAGLHP